MWRDYLYWQAQDKKTLKRINQLIKDIERNGCLCGIGEPEALRADLLRHIFFIWGFIYGKSRGAKYTIDYANKTAKPEKVVIFNKKRVAVANVNSHP